MMSTGRALEALGRGGVEAGSGTTGGADGARLGAAAGAASSLASVRALAAAGLALIELGAGSV